MWTNKLRFVATLSALLITGFLITSLVSYYVANKSLSDEINQNTLPLTSDNIYSEIQRDLLRPIFISSLMANDTFVRDWTLAGEEDPDKIIRYLKEIQKRYSTITAFLSPTERVTITTRQAFSSRCRRAIRLISGITGCVV